MSKNETLVDILFSICFVFFSDKAYSDALLKAAKEIYTFASTYKGKYSDSITNARSFYK